MKRRLRNILQSLRILVTAAPLAALLAVFPTSPAGAAMAGDPASPAAETTWRLRVFPAACAAGERVLLSEIAAPGPGFPESAWRTLAATPLWAAPEKNGASMAVAVDKLAGALRYYLRDAPVDFDLPGQFVLRRGGSVILEDNLRHMAVEYLTPRLKELPGEAALGEISPPPYLFLDDPGANPRLEARGALAAGKSSLEILVEAPGGKAVKKGSIPVEIKAFGPIPRASRPINPKDGAVVPDMVAVERGDLAQLRGTPWDGSGGPWRVKSAVGQGQPVYVENLEPMPAVSKGDKVTLAYRGAHVRLSLEVEAVTDGLVGGEITVRNLQSDRKIVAIVENENTVVAR